MSTYASCYYVSLNALDEMHLSRVFYVFLNTSNKLRDNVVISIVNNLYLISIYIYIYTFLTRRIDFLVRWHLYFAAILLLTTAHPPQNDRVPRYTITMTNLLVTAVSNADATLSKLQITRFTR